MHWQQSCLHCFSESICTIISPLLHRQERITGLPSEFLSTPIGQMIMPMLTPLEAQMKQMNGQAMFAGNNHQVVGAGPATSAPASAAPVVEPGPPGRAAGKGLSS